VPDERRVITEQIARIVNLTGKFERQVEGILASAQARVVGQLQRRLVIEDGQIQRTPGNQQVLRRIDRMFSDSMERAGYGRLTEEFVQTFDGALPQFQEMLEAISVRLKTPLQVQFAPRDIDLFTTQKISAASQLETVVDGIAAAAKRRALFSVGALEFGDMVEQIATAFGRTVSEASGLAATSQSMFFRTVADRGYQQIEKGLKPGSVKYSYEGPRDKLTRPFCRRLLERTSKEPMTRSQIDALDNGSLPNAFITGGGWSCRHQWVVAEMTQAGQGLAT